ncbi:hypothetical protein Tco_0243447 [Tanacetum coccineum]
MRKDDKWEDDWFMALVTPPKAALLTRPDTPPLPSSIPAPLPIDPFMFQQERDHVHSTFEVGGPSSAAPDAPHPVGRPFSVVASRVALYHQDLGALHPWKTATEERVQSLSQDVEYVQDMLDVAETEVFELRYRVDAYPRKQDARAEIQDLQTRLSTSEKCEMSLITRLLRMEERISALEQRPSGQQGTPDSSR